MVPLDGTSQFTGDEDRVAHLRARPEDGSSGGHGAQQGDIEEQGARAPGGFPADQRDADLTRKLGHAPIHGFDPFG